MNLHRVRIEVVDEEPLDIPGTGIVAHWYHPAKPGPRNGRGVVVLPIQGGDYEVSTMFAEYFASRGYHALRFERRAEWLDPSVPLDKLKRLVPQFVADIRKGMDVWLASEGAPAADRVGLFGVSMGAMTGTLVAAADPRIARSVFCIGGGDLADILVDGRDEELDAWRAAVTAQLGGPEAFAQAARLHVGEVDILGAARSIDAGSNLFIAARFDRVVPWKASLKLWEAIGQPKRMVLPTGHYSAVVAVPIIKSAALRWLDAGLL